jgi:hypothetical protein
MLDSTGRTGPNGVERQVEYNQVVGGKDRRGRTAANDCGVPRRGLELAHKRLIQNIVSTARPRLPTKNPTTETTLARVLPITPQWSKFPAPTHAESWSTQRHNAGTGRPHKGRAIMINVGARGCDRADDHCRVSVIVRGSESASRTKSPASCSTRRPALHRGSACPAAPASG